MLAILIYLRREISGYRLRHLSAIVVFAALFLTLIRPVSPAASQEQPTPVGQDGEWTLIFNDEFEGSSLDESKWSLCYWWDNDGCSNEGNNELEWYMPDDVLVEDGALRLRAQERTIEASNGQTYDYTSGMVTTGPPNYKTDPAKFTFRYGYAEIRAKVPAGQGFWPAFWMLPDNFTSKPEIDVLEILGHEPDLINMVIHYLDEDDEPQRGLEKWVGPDFSQDWHTYAVNWTPDAVIWYVDGVERWRFDDIDYVPATNLYILLNLAVGGDWPGPPDETTVFPNYFEIDYVRIWQPGSVVVEQTDPSEDGEFIPVGLEGDWSLIFHDEFDGSSLDESKWSTCYWWDNEGCTNEGSGDLQWYMPDDILVEDGLLRLRARERSIEASNEQTYDYTSGMVTTGPPNYKTDPAKFVFRYGYVETRARIPAGQGLLSAFWMLPDDFTSKPGIDGAIIRGGEPSVMHMGLYYLDENEESQEESATWVGPDFSEDWHVYGMHWTPNSLTWYVDGVEQWRFEDIETVPATTLYLLFNLTVGGGAGSLDSSVDFPSYFELDYVRVWQSQEG